MFFNKKVKNCCIGFISCILLVVVDQITKILAISNLKDKEAFSIIDNIFELRYLENQSAAFGVDLVSILHKIFKFKYFNENPESFLHAKMLFFAVVTILVIVCLILLYAKIPTNKQMFWLNLIIVLFVAGAIGNLIDRIIKNYVVDFFYFKLINFPIFNVADIYVTVAAFLFIILGLFYYKEEDYDAIFKKKKENKNYERDL